MTEIAARLADGVASVPAADWDACAGDANPFVSHAFLSALEDSGSAVARAGWQPLPFLVDGADGRQTRLLGAAGRGVGSCCLALADFSLAVKFCL